MHLTLSHLHFVHEENSSIKISVQIDERGPHEQQIRELIHKKGLEFIRSQIAIYLKELKEEYR